MKKKEKLNFKGFKEVSTRQEILDWVDSCVGKQVDVHKKQGCPGFFGVFDVLHSYETEHSVDIDIKDGIYLVAGNIKLKTDIPFMYDEEETKIYSSDNQLVFILPQGYKGNNVIYIIEKI